MPKNNKKNGVSTDDFGSMDFSIGGEEEFFPLDPSIVGNDNGMPKDAPAKLKGIKDFFIMLLSLLKH